MFKVGDRVRINEGYFFNSLGTVVKIVEDSLGEYVFEVQFDKDPDDDIWICEEYQISHYFNGVQRMIEVL